jgi:outer membrane protein insertion porin family
MKKLFTLSVGLSSILLSQNISSVQYNGLLHLSPEIATEISGIHAGDPFDIGKIDASLKKLYAQGYFSDITVGINEQGVLLYNFKEKSVISKLEMNGYSSDDEQEELFISMGLKKGDLYDARKIERAKKKLIKKIEAEGYYDTVVEVEVEPKEDSISLVFEVNKGEKIQIEKIDFSGAKKLDNDELESQMANQEEDFMGWLPGLSNGVAKLDQLPYDGKRAQDVYLQNGYMDAEVSDPLMRIDSGSYKADVTYQVKEGEQYRVADITIKGNVEGLNLDEVKNEFKLLKGKIFNISKLRKDQTYIQEQVANLGYAYARVRPNFSKDSKNHTVSIQYTIAPGKKVYINDVIISGNHTTKDRVIRRDIYLAPGDLFSLTDLKDSKNALGRRGFFEKVDIEQQRVDDTNINLLVKVKETPTGSIQAGGGYGSYQGVMLSASVSDRNVLGSGINAGVSFDISQISVNYSLSVTNPRIWDSDYSLGMSLYQSEFQYVTYNQKTIGAGLNVGKQLTRNLFGSLSYGYSSNKSTLVDNSNSITAVVDYFSIFAPEDLNYVKSTFGLGLNYDSTDDFYIPREGFILGGNLGYAGLGGDQKFIDTTVRFGAYYGLEDLIDYDMILRYKLRGTVLTDQGAIAKPEKLFMGGIGSVRGYQPYSIAPFNDTANGREFLGGTKRLINTVEASVPLSEAAKMRLAFFYDYGMIGQSSFNEIIKEGAGVSLEWISPMGPINLVFARAINPDALDRTANFEFTMGQKF